ncbi:hypothetical protein COL154_009826 [Colletotrichum chrysophilum]|uniref:uncharacterized protein n=1 Tax=Colletotrichum chrysophilum TaxID=1836956 RepID=UPI002301B212|nr:uncharacterized protein COL26b_009922 [Colletotrichum chrysophilum]KAJ0344873.1 hypothetical protein KNSL1_008969 [Colletotrichum chrysophilum]KAJ0357716.1 hypothetical protein COL154_009826 [Colletotrichum chrysophilum]KAJ0370630.1 hypothetical protein COL26b_009922 [Colletotrichum chrysophilum]
MATVTLSCPDPLAKAMPMTQEQIEAELYIPPFDPAIHLDYKPPTRRHTFTDLGLPVPKGCPDMCYTEPFHLFSEEGIRMIRREAFRREFLDKYMKTYGEKEYCIIRGYGDSKGDGIFVKQAWNHPVTQAAVNSAYGHALRLQSGEVALGYINVQLGDGGGVSSPYELPEEPMKPKPRTTDLVSEGDLDEDEVLDMWHKDMAPVVIVLMLSDTSTMLGGETVIKMGDGRMKKVRGASVGGAVMMTGGYLEHSAIRVRNCGERLSLVNSYDFLDPDADDTATSLRSFNLRCDSLVKGRNTIMAQKLWRLRERCDLAIKRVNERDAEGEMPSQEEVEAWVRDQIHLLKHTSWEMFERVPNYVGKELPVDALQNHLSDV